MKYQFMMKRTNRVVSSCHVLQDVCDKSICPLALHHKLIDEEIAHHAMKYEQQV